MGHSDENALYSQGGIICRWLLGYVLVDQRLRLLPGEAQGRGEDEHGIAEEHALPPLLARLGGFSPLLKQFLGAGRVTQLLEDLVGLAKILPQPLY